MKKREERQARLGPGGRLLAVTAAMIGAVFLGIVAWLSLDESEEAAAPTAAHVELVIPLSPPGGSAPAETASESKPTEGSPTGQTAESKSGTPGAESSPSEGSASQSQPTPSKSPSPGEAQPPQKAQQPAPSMARALATAPDPALVEAGPEGPLPKVAADGRTPWQNYARPFDRAEQRPKIAIVVTNLGLSDAATEAAIQRLPGAVTLGFSPYAGTKLAQWSELARSAGHEVILSLPMEPANYPDSDPGPHTLLTSLNAEQNLERLRWMLSRFAGYVGVTNHMGARFTASADALRPVLNELKGRGLLFLDSRAAQKSVATSVASELGLPRTANDRFLDTEAARAAIDARLAEIEQIARRKGVAVAIGYPFPVTIERLEAWAQTLDSKGLVLVPISAIVSTGAEP